MHPGGNDHLTPTCEGEAGCARRILGGDSWPLPSDDGWGVFLRLRVSVMKRQIRELARLLYWLAFGLFVMAFWLFQPRRGIDMDATWWRRFDRWWNDGH